MTSDWSYSSACEADTETFGSALASVLPMGSVVALLGPLGAGKTRLVQALASAVGLDPRTVTSPTFVLVHEYPGRVPIAHFDAYRLRDEDEFWQLGPEEYFSRPGWSLIEWADRVPGCLPDDVLTIRLQVTGPETRRIEVRASGPESADVLRQLQLIFKAG